jgi:Transmembrane exosortase (Exosortase_EpsH)
MQRLSKLGSFLVQERHWVFLFLAYATAWVIPFQWMKEYWFLEYQVTAPQPLVLLGFPIALWGSRQRLAAFWERVKQSERYSRRRQSEGSVVLLIVGCLLYFFAHFSRLALVGILGLVLMLLGVLVRAYGRRILGALSGPVAYLFLVVPWLPETALGIVNQQSMKVYLSLVTSILFRIGYPTQYSGNTLQVRGLTVPLTFQLFGAQGIFLALVFFWGYGLARNLPGRRIMLQVVVGSVVAFLVHLCRILLMCLIAPSNLNLSNRLGSATPWIFSVISIGLTFVVLTIAKKIRRPSWLDSAFRNLEQFSSAVQRPIDRALSGVAKTGQGVGKGVTTLFSPLTWLLDKALGGFGGIFKLLGRSNRAIEKAIRDSERKRKQKK